MPSRKWNTETLLEFVRERRYSRLKEWRLDHPSSYNTAVRLGVSHEIEMKLNLKRCKRNKRGGRVSIEDASRFVNEVDSVTLPKVFEAFWRLEFGMNDEVPVFYTETQMREFLFDRLVDGVER